MAGLKHCSFDGCLSKRNDEGLSFFSLPGDETRRKQWLEIMNRPDLDKPYIKSKSYVVCSKHFDKSSIIFTPKLKSDAIPTRFIQEPETCDQDTQSKQNIKEADKKETLSKSTQTSMDLSENKPRKRKLPS